MNADGHLPNTLRPILFWSGFPVCGLLLKKVAREFGENVVICGTKGAVPYEGLEEELGHDIVWFDDPNDIWERRGEFSDRNLIFHSGWSFPGWHKYDRLMRRKGAKVVVMADNRYRGTLRQRLGAFWFRVALKRRFDAALVPGEDGKKLLAFLGMDESRIFTGLYGAYEGIYTEVVPIENRNREFLFVGQLIKRKAVDILLEAFREYRKKGGTWSLRLVGHGPLAGLCHGDGVTLEGFSQPDAVAQKMNAARVLVLPSRDENWGTVVCEAAACGMHLITSKSVGASADIVRNGENGIVLEQLDAAELQKAFFECERMPEGRLREGSRISKEIARRFGSDAFFGTFKQIAGNLLSRGIQLFP
jgi:glycosyltransferase involved in cell wall biosynthesis